VVTLVVLASAQNFPSLQFLHRVKYPRWNSK
jgi:hypothetical protein